MLVHLVRHNRRRGVSTVTLLLVTPVLLLLVGLVVYLGLLRDARGTAQHGADAAALAGARLLADDALLLPNSPRFQQRLMQARQAAQALGQMNFALDERLQLDANADNDPDGDIVIGRLDRPLNGTLIAYSEGAAPASDWPVNAVRVRVRRPPLAGVFRGPAPPQEIAAVATAWLDRRVVGYRPLTDDPIPLMPIGLFTDHTGNDPALWDGLLRAGNDSWSYDWNNRRWLPGGDGIPEAVLSAGVISPAGFAFLQIGAEDFAATIRQVGEGIGRDELVRQFGAGGFVLRGDNSVEVPGSAAVPPPASATRQRLIEQLQAVAATGQPRLWPLLAPASTADGPYRVVGWAGARLVKVEELAVVLRLTLQPTVLPHPSAVTEPREPPPAFWTANRTVCRVRLAE